jgi:predicted alpha/beta hydrolase family esterase
MPNPAEPKIEPWVKKITEIAKDADENTIFIAHSIGCQATLRFLEKSKIKKIKGLFLVAGWMKLKEENYADPESGEETRRIAKPWITSKIDFKKISEKTDNVVYIVADNDPFVSLDDSKIFKKELGAKVIIEHDKSHYEESIFWSIPVLLEEINRIK